MKAAFTATPKNGKLAYSNPEDLYRYLIEQDGTDLYIEMKPLAKISEKVRMLRYLHGPLLATAVKAYAEDGFEFIDKVAALYKLKAEFARGVIFNTKTGTDEYYLKDISSMDKKELLKFINDVVLYLEMNFFMETPDSEVYKNMLKYGKSYKTAL